MDFFQRHSEELTAVLLDNSRQRKRILKMREIVQKWLNASSLMISDNANESDEFGEANAVLGAPLLTEAREILQSIQREEQIVLNQRVREQEWAVQSTQVLNFIPKLERAASEMQKEERGYLLTADPVFIESYKRGASAY